MSKIVSGLLLAALLAEELSMWLLPLKTPSS